MENGKDLNEEQRRESVLGAVSGRFYLWFWKTAPHWVVRLYLKNNIKDMGKYEEKKLEIINTMMQKAKEETKEEKRASALLAIAGSCFNVDNDGECNDCEWQGKKAELKEHTFCPICNSDNVFYY